MLAPITVVMQVEEVKPTFYATINESYEWGQYYEDIDKLAEDMYYDNMCHVDLFIASKNGPGVLQATNYGYEFTPEGKLVTLYPNPLDTSCPLYPKFLIFDARLRQALDQLKIDDYKV